jgi:hypothetical protein
MHKYLSRAISRLHISEANLTIRVYERLPGLHPIHLHWSWTGMTDRPFLAVGSRHPRCMTDVHLRKHEAVKDCGSYEVWFDDGRPSKFFSSMICRTAGCGLTS